MNASLSLSFGLVLGLAAAGCSHQAKPVVTPTNTDATPGPAATTTKPAVTTNQAVSPNLGVSSDIADKCKIHTDPTSAPKFDFDQANLLPEDRKVLDQLAECLTNGPLKGQQIMLIGRADPRGTDEYNLGLGSTRAHSVGSYLEKLGVGVPQLAVTTRGSLDATGTDEAGWRDDRRVDIQLKGG